MRALVVFQEHAAGTLETARLHVAVGRVCAERGHHFPLAVSHFRSAVTIIAAQRRGGIELADTLNCLGEAHAAHAHGLHSLLARGLMLPNLPRRRFQEHVAAAQRLHRRALRMLPDTVTGAVAAAVTRHRVAVVYATCRHWDLAMVVDLVALKQVKKMVKAAGVPLPPAEDDDNDDAEGDGGGGGDNDGAGAGGATTTVTSSPSGTASAGAAGPTSTAMVAAPATAAATVAVQYGAGRCGVGSGNGNGSGNSNSSTSTSTSTTATSSSTSSSSSNNNNNSAGPHAALLALAYARILGHIGVVQDGQGHWEVARKTLQRALEVALKYGDKSQEVSE